MPEVMDQMDRMESHSKSQYHNFMKKENIKNSIEFKDSIDNVVLGTIANRTRDDADLGMMSTERFEREEYERCLRAGIDFTGSLITDADRKKVIEKVLADDPEKIVGENVRHGDHTERVKKSMTREITKAREILQEKKVPAKS